MNSTIKWARDSRNSGPCPRRTCSADYGQRLQGLSAEDARQKLQSGRTRLGKTGPGAHVLSLLFGQFKSPIILILVFAAVLSLCLGQATDALIILAIVLASGLLGFWQEWGAADAVKKLLALVQTKASVLRDGRPVDVPAEQVVPGDVVLLHAGDIIPGDGRILDESDLFVAEASLTGETFPVEKAVGVVPSDAPLGRRTNCVFLGTSVVSGTARLLVVRTGRDTEFGRISGSLRLRPPETGFERGIRRFGYLLLEVTLLLVLAIFAINVGPAPAGPGVVPFLGGDRRRPDPATASGHHQRQPGPWCTPHGQRAGHRPQAGVHREPRRHGRVLLGQDRHADRGQGAAARGRRCWRQAERADGALRLSERLFPVRLLKPDRRGDRRRRVRRRRPAIASSTRSPTISSANDSACWSPEAGRTCW